jgi:hypothetical protein
MICLLNILKMINGDLQRIDIKQVTPSNLFNKALPLVMARIFSWANQTGLRDLSGFQIELFLAL